MRWLILSVITLLLAFGCLLCGPVDIPASEVLKALAGQSLENDVWRIIILESRLPMMLTALTAGAALSTAGLLMQTTFQNPLAGPSILGVSSGASLGVAIVMLAGGALVSSGGVLQYISEIIGAGVGSMAIIILLISFSSFLRNGTILLIVGIMISYLANSIITLLNLFAPSEGVKSFVVWGMGSYAGVSGNALWVLLGCSAALLIFSIFYCKPLNALLLGERYTANMGYDIKRLRTGLLLTSGLLTAVVTAFCGPIGFLGLIVPHIARLIFGTSNHTVLIPASMLCGAAVSLLCTFLSLLPKDAGTIPINAITPVIGVPIIIYIIVNRKRIKYFN